MTKIFPVIILILSLCAAVVCLVGHEYNKGLYWLGASVIAFSLIL